MLWALATGMLARRASPVRLRLRIPAISLAMVGLASALVAMAGDPFFISAYPGIRGAASDLMAGQLFDWIRPWIPLHLALIMSLALFIAVQTERAVRLDRQIGVRLIRMLVAGHAAAVAISLSRLTSAALRDEEFISNWIRIMSEVRYYSQYDVNAAGSTLVIVVCAGLGLLTAAHRLVTFVAMLLALAGVWVTGSRAALVALITVLLTKALLDVLFAGGRRARISTVAIGAVVAAITAGLYVYYPAGRNVAASVAYESRMIMLRTAWRAGLSDPAFGVGIGRLPERGRDFGSTDMHRLMGAQGVRENAHNQYLQVFAELGLLGIAALGLVIGSIGWTAILRSPGDPLLSWAAWGVVATLLTWFLGHPLLVPEAAVIFWLFLGIIAGLSPAPATHATAGKVARVCGVSLAAFVAIMTPVRATQAARLAYLEHYGVGVSAVWHHDADISYRLAGASFALFLPSSTTVTVPLRAARPSGDSIVIEVFLRSRLIDRIEVSTGEWRRVRILLPESDREFERVDFVVVGKDADSTDQGVVRVGKATALASTEGR
jgi:O-antigen ligase